VKPPKASRADSTITACTMLTKQGDPRGKPGQVGLPPGVCAEHAIAVFRAVSAMVNMEAST
jgi:hypothetical protein